MKHASLGAALLLLVGVWAQAEEPLAGDAARLYQQAMDTGRFTADFRKLSSEVLPTADGRSYYTIYKTVPNPERWVVSLHGAGNPAKGYATDDLVVWQPHLKGRKVGLLCLQWWLGTGSATKDFYTPLEIYRALDAALQTLGVKPGNALLHGFSRGSANSYAVAAIDAGKGRQYFSLIVASSGGMSPDYPPNRDLLRGDYGDRPLENTRWITVAGARDQNPERDGVEGMARTAQWLKEQGAIVVESMEDGKYGHGAFHLNARNVDHVLDLFLNQPDFRKQ